jgi:ankyrin repeat protein
VTPPTDLEVRRRDLLERRDLVGLADLLREHPDQATSEMLGWTDHPLGAAPLNFVAMLRCDNRLGIWKDVPGTGPVARMLLDAGAPVDGNPGESETPLMTAASYGDAEVARVLVDAGADLEARSAPDSGGVPGGSALLHAAVFGNTEVLDLLVAAGAAVPGLVEAAAVGDVSGHDLAAYDEQTRLLALVMAADHQRVAVLDALVAAGTPYDVADGDWGRHPLRLAAGNGRPASVRRLLELGADPCGTDDDGNTPLDLCRAGRASYPDGPGFDEVERLLQEAR